MDQTTHPELSPERQASLDRYREDVASGRTLRTHAMSARSVRGDWVVTSRRPWAHCIQTLGRMAAVSDPLAQVVRGILGKVPLYQTGSEAVAKVYEAAAQTMSAGYEDVIRGAGPEPGRRRDRRRDWTLAERVAVMVWLELATHELDRTPFGIGWALHRLVEETGAWGMFPHEAREVR